MHEYSIVADLLNLAHNEANKHNAKKIHKILVALGERSGVESALLKSCFDTFKKEDSLVEDSELEIIHKNIKLFCNDCKSEFYAKDLEYGICIQCNSLNVEIIEGFELHLLSLEME